MSALFCFGLGYSATAFARVMREAGWSVSGTSRTAEGAAAAASLGFDCLVFDGAQPGGRVREALQAATHVLVSAAPGEAGDPVLRHHAADLARAPAVQWIGYLSTIGVYGDSGGAWVDEECPLNPGSPRALRRVAAEQAWGEFARETGKRVEIFRLGGIYGPGRSALDDLRDGSARRIVKPGQVFNRIHVADIAGVLHAAALAPSKHAIYNVVDDEPAPPQDVVAFAASLIGVAPPPEIPFAEADMTPMGRSFYAESRRVSNRRIRDDLGVSLAFPSYREGLRAVLAAGG